MATMAIIVEYQVPQENRAAFDVQLRHNVEATLRDEGCLRMEILQHATAAANVVLSELWAMRCGSSGTGSGRGMTRSIKRSTGC